MKFLAEFTESLMFSPTLSESGIGFPDMLTAIASRTSPRRTRLGLDTIFEIVEQAIVCTTVFFKFFLEKWNELEKSLQSEIKLKFSIT